MSKPTKHHFHAHAALIPLLHAARYPHLSVIGCLLGSQPPQSSEKGITIDYTHAIPLLHHWTGLNYALEMGLQLVEEYALLQQLQILGFYFAREGLQNKGVDLPILIKRLQEQLLAQSKFDDKGKAKSTNASEDYTPSIFELDNKNLTSETKALNILPFASSASSDAKIIFSSETTQTPASSESQSVKAAKAPTGKSASPTRLTELIKTNQHLKVDDFDAHLEDIGARWLENEAVDL